MNAGKLAGLKSIYSNCKSGAKKRKFQFELQLIDIINLIELQDYKCALSSLELKVADNRHGQKHGESTASIDRIDSNKGYTLDNIQWVHKDVNRMKWMFTTEEFLYYCNCIIETHKNTTIKPHKTITNKININYKPRMNYNDAFAIKYITSSNLKLNNKELAAIFNVSPRNVEHIRYKRIWKHIIINKYKPEFIV